MYCNNCRRYIDNTEAAFCPECGSRLVPAPFAGDLPPAGNEEAEQATELITEAVPQPGPEAQAAPAYPEAAANTASPADAPLPQAEPAYRYASEGSDTEAFSIAGQGGSTAQMPAAAPAMSPPPLRTGDGRSRGRKKAAASSNQGKGVPLALIIVPVIALVLVAGLVFLWFYFDLELSDITEMFSKKQDSAGSSALYQEDTGASKNDGLLPDKDTANSGDAANNGGGAAPTPAPAPTEVPRAEATDSTVVLRSAHSNGRLLVNGVDTPFEYVGEDIVIQRSDLPEICQILFIAENNGAYEMAAIWYSSQSENDLSLTEGSGGYVPCDANGLGKPGTSFINTLLWVYHEGFLRAINEQSTAYLRYSTEKNTNAENDHVFSTANARNTYDLNNFSAECDANSITYSNDGKITLNATFVSYATNRQNGNRAQVVSRKTMELLWENGVWKINRLAFVNDNDYAAGRYADLP